MAEMKFLRLTPFNKNTGALARRYCVGGKLFVEGKWYTLPARSANRLVELKQSSGAPYFQVLTQEQFQETSRNEVAAAMHAAGLAGLAMHGADLMKTPEVKTFSDGPRKSEFAGLDAAAKDVDVNKSGWDVQDSDEGEDAVDDSESDAGATVEASEGPPDFSDMNRKDLLSLAQERGVDIPSHTRLPGIIELLSDSYDE